MLTDAEFAGRLHVSKRMVQSWRRARKVIAVHGARHGFRYPNWQIDKHGRPFAAIERIFTEFDDDQWAAWQ